MKRLFLALAMLLGVYVPAWATSAGCLPTTGVFSGLQEQENINAAIAVLINNARGGSAPTIDCSGASVEGEIWFNTSNGSYPILALYDGTQYDPIGTLDIANDIWMPVQGGGIGSVLSAATVDLCSVPQNIISITGTTTINSFGSSCEVGQIKQISFAGTLLVAESAGAILTPSGYSISTSSVDTAEAIYTGGGIWKIVNYQSGGVSVPVGAEIISATRTGQADPGFFAEDGECESQAAYPALYAKVGLGWGGISCPAGEFAVPDMQGRTAYGYDANGVNRLTSAGFGEADTTIGNVGGAEKKVVAQANLAPFTLPSSATGSVSGSITNSATGGQAFVGSTGVGTSGSGSAAGGNVGVAEWSGSISVATSVSSGGANTPLPTAAPGSIHLYEIKY